MKNKYQDDYDDNKVGKKSPTPKDVEYHRKGRYQDDYEDIIEEEEEILSDDTPLVERTDEEEQIWLDYLSSQEGVSSQGGTLTPEIER